MTIKKGSFRGCVIAGTHSGAGKTTWSLALMALAQKKGLLVQPFKIGPDYIDPGFHHRICTPRKSRNLDRFFLSEETLRDTFWRNAASSDLAVVEGVMGLFDGKKISGEEASTAQMAKLLGLPVFLVLDGSGMATSAAAIVLGFQKFDPDLKLAGIFLNRVSSAGHFSWLKNAVEERTGVPCLGHLPDEPSLRIPERHLGLTTMLETQDAFEKAERAAALLEERFDWERFWEISSLRGGRRPTKQSSEKADCFAPSGLAMTAGPISRNDRVCRIGVAYDAAFSFYYEDNFDLLQEAGAKIVFFSPLEDEGLPLELDLLYFGGGFPEMMAARLAANHLMMEAVRRFYAEGGAIYAECGGLMYLAESLIDREGKAHSMAGLIPGRVLMTDRLQHFGYHEIESLSDSFLVAKGERLRSHEFHYSKWDGEGTTKAAYRIAERSEGFIADRLVASYQHLHFGQDPGLAVRMVERLSRASASQS